VTAVTSFSGLESSATQQVAIVTGGATGIGKACAQALVDVGYAVAIADVSMRGQKVAAQLAEDGGRALFVRTDMADVGQIRALMDTTVQEFGRLDVLVNNASVTRVLDFYQVTEADWDQILTVNARGYFFAMQLAAERMEATAGGRIVNMASIAGKGFRETTNIAYASSKGAVIIMTRIAAARLGPVNIRVNAICPGMTKTDMWSNWIDDRAVQEGVARDVMEAEMSAKVPLKRLNESSDIAALVVFLASDASHTITGQSINVDGGVMWD
jgi:NAD(P)-dependent dehydrogenase (short-subunit alcohol dehydrogenase family)